MPAPKRWPVNANWARQRAIDDAEDIIDEAAEALGSIAEGQPGEAIDHMKVILRKANGIASTLVAAKYGERHGEEADFEQEQKT